MFQEDFCKHGLVTLIASACNFRYPDLTCCNQNLIITLYYMQPDFYKDSNWANTASPYKPYSTIPTTLTYKYYDGGTLKSFTMKDTDVQRYDNSVSYETGWFRKEILLAAEVSQGNTKFDTTPCWRY